MLVPRAFDSAVKQLGPQVWILHGKCNQTSYYFPHEYFFYQDYISLMDSTVQVSLLKRITKLWSLANHAFSYELESMGISRWLEF